MRIKVSQYTAKPDSRTKLFLVEHNVKTLFMQGSDKKIRLVPTNQHENFTPNWRKQEIIGGKYLRAARYLAAKEMANRAAKYFTPKN